MSGGITEELPAFLHDEIVYCATLTRPRKQRTCLVLLRNLKFYEFQGKAVLSFIDLNGTCLAQRKQEITHYKGNRGKWKTSAKNYEKSSQQSSSSQTIELLESDIAFGKFIYQNFNEQKLYLLIKCWDKLIVLQYLTTDNEKLIVKSEYEDVQSFRIVHGKIKFQAAVEIKQSNGIMIVTNFNDDDGYGADELVPTKVKTSQKAMKQENFKQFLERIRSAKTELLVHKTLTQREFTRLRTLQSIGCSELRSAKLEERLLLARCGDVWMRLTVNDDVVIGVTMVNNGSSDACTILKNIRPVFKAHSGNLSYKFRLYHLHQQFADLESLETFFDSESDLEPDSYSWHANASAHIMPESFAVLCIKLSLLEIISLQETPFFIYYDIDRGEVCSEAKTGETVVESSPEVKTNSSKLFNQQVFIKNLNFSLMLSQRQNFEISFEKTTLHQDFLAIAMTAEETSLALTFKDEADLKKFEQLLIERFHFQKVNRDVSSNSISMAENMDDDDELPVEAIDKNAFLEIKQRFAHSLFYNRNAASMWYGTLALRCLADENSSLGIKIYWKFYTSTRKKAYLLYKMLFDDFLLYKCNVEKVEFSTSKHQHGIQFEHALREELNYALKVSKEIAVTHNQSEENLLAFVDQLLRLELQTDLSAQNLV